MEKKRGCSGFIKNVDNNSIVYINTEGIKWYDKDRQYLYRYADTIKDYSGYHNRWANSLEDLSSNILELLKVPVLETRDFRI